MIRERRSTSKWRVRALSGAIAATLIVLVSSAPAQAAEVRNHPFLKTLISGTEGSPPQAKLEAPCGVAVDSSGEIFISDYYRRAIFSATAPAYSPVSLGLPAYFPANGPCALAADPFNLYANYRHGGVVNVAGGVISNAPATGIAVDPTSFDLYVNQRNRIAVYSAPVEPGEAPSLEIDPGSEGALKDGYGIAVSDFPATAGWIYVADAADHTVKVYDPGAPEPDVPIQAIGGDGTAAGRFVSLVDATLAIDQQNGHLFVVDNVQPGFEHPLAAISEFNTEGIYRGALDRTVVHGRPTGIAVDESPTAANGRVYVTSGNGSSVVIPPAGGPTASELGALYAFGPAGAGQSLEVTVSGGGGGTVKSTPAGIACPGACKAELNEGAIVTLLATPAPDSDFAGWSGDCAGTGSCQVTLASATSVQAEFVPAPATLSSAAVGGGGGAAAGLSALAPGAPPEAPALRLGRPSVEGATVLLPVSATAPGSFSATAKAIRPAVRACEETGPCTLRLRLNRFGRRALAAGEDGRLTLRVAVAFKARGGGAVAAAQRNVTFKQTDREKR